MQIRPVYPGHSEYDLDVSAKPDIKTKRKKAILDVDALWPQGKVSIIL